MTAKILIIEDDNVLNHQLSQLAESAGYLVESCSDGNSGLVAASSNGFDLVLLDLMLPERDGITMLSMLRKSSQVPVIIVSAKGAEQERITGLRRGADDYIAKPFNPTELLLRIEALLRRSQPERMQPAGTVALDDLKLDLRQHRAQIGTTHLDLTHIQFKLLWELALHHGEILSKAYLSQKVLNKTLGAFDRGLDMHLSRIRRKLNQTGWSGERLQTVRGNGYLLK